MNKKRPEVPEDILIASAVVRAANRVGLTATASYDVSLSKRGPLETIFYAGLTLFPWLRPILPCTRDFVFLKT